MFRKRDITTNSVSNLKDQRKACWLDVPLLPFLSYTFPINVITKHPTFYGNTISLSKCAAYQKVSPNQLSDGN